MCEVVWFSYYACIKEPMEHLFVVKEILFMYAGRKKTKILQQIGAYRFIALFSGAVTFILVMNRCLIFLLSC